MHIGSLIRIIYMNAAALLMVAGLLLLFYILLSTAKIVHWYIQKNNITWRCKP